MYAKGFYSRTHLRGLGGLKNDSGGVFSRSLKNEDDGLVVLRMVWVGRSRVLLKIKGRFRILLKIKTTNRIYFMFMLTDE